jgi:hypothetical protein
VQEERQEGREAEAQQQSLMSMSNRRGAAAATVFLAAAVLFGSAGSSDAAAAEVVQKDGVRVKVDGRMAPTKLPRARATRVAVSVSGSISSTVPGALPKLERISIAINSFGQLRTGGIPACRIGHIDPSTSYEALRACGSSLIGQGLFSADVKIPEQSPFPSEGKVLAFNGRLRGRPAIFAHIYGRKPVPTSYVLPFEISKGRGTYGTVLEASLPSVTGEWGYVTGVSINFERRFVEATCPAPDGFPGVVFPLMRTSFGFEGGPTLRSIVDRSCTVR